MKLKNLFESGEDERSAQFAEMQKRMENLPLTGDPTKDGMLQFLAMHHYPLDNTKWVDVAPCTPEIRAHEKRVRMKECFNNCWHLCSMIPGAKYVLGYTASFIPIEHAWIKIGETYYDPTLELLHNRTGDAYLVYLELSMKELIKYTTKNANCPPALWDMYRMGYFKK